MSRRALAILALVVVAAFAGLALVERFAGRLDEASEDEPLLEFEPREVDAVEISSLEARFRLEKREDGSWFLGDGETGEADPRQVTDLLKALADARAERVVEENAEDLERYELDPPALTARIEVSGRDAPIGVELGRPSPVAWQRYAAREGTRRVVLVPGSLGTALEREPSDFREMRLAPIEAAEIRTITLRRGTEVLGISKSGGSWRVVRPFDDAADAAACDRLARTLASLRMTRLVRPDYELPASRIEIEVGGGEPEVTVSAWIATEVASGERLAFRGRRPSFGMIADLEARDLAMAPEDLRDRVLARFSNEDVDEVRWTRDGRIVSCVRNDARPGWSVRREDGEPQPASAGSVEALLDAVRWLRAESFAVTSADAPPSVEITLSGGGSEIAHLSWGTREDGPGRWITARGRPGVVAVPSKAALDDLEKKLGEAVP